MLCDNCANRNINTTIDELKMTVEEKLKEYDLFDQSIIRHGNLDNIRDYEIIGYLCGQDFNLEVKYIFKGCIQVQFKNTVEPRFFLMDDRLLHLDRQDEPDYPQAFIWDAGAIVYPGWKHIENSDELKKLEALYKINFYKLDIETNAYELTLTFNDLETLPQTKHLKTKL